MIKIKHLPFLSLFFCYQCFAVNNQTISDGKIVHNLCVQSIANIDPSNDKDKLDKICYDADNYKNSYINNVKKMYLNQNKEIKKDEMVKFNQINTLFLLKNEYDANKKNNMILSNRINHYESIGKLSDYIYSEYE